jgi:hypothetical protein
MHINENITVNLSPQDITSLIKDYLENKGYEVNNISFNINERTEGNFMHEYNVKYFAGANCKVTRK